MASRAEQLMFIRMKRRRRLVDTAAAALSRGAEPDFRFEARLIAECVLTFVCDYGGRSELGFDTVRYLLSLESSEDESAFAAMIRQVERGEYYDKEIHQWVDNPHRKADPDSASVQLYREWKKAEPFRRTRALKLVRRNAAALGSWPGDAAIAAALLVDLEEFRGRH